MPGIRISTSDPDEASYRCGQVYFPHRLETLHEPGRFSMSLSAAALGPVSAGLLGYAGEVRLTTGVLETGYEINIPLTGALRTSTGHGEVCATPETAAVYRPDGRATLHGWADGGRLFGLKIDCSALEWGLHELVGCPVGPVVPLSASLDLRHGPGRQWWTLASSLIELIRNPDGPLCQPMVARPLAEAIIGLLLHAVDHPYRGALASAPRPARPPSIHRAVDLLEGQPDVPWTVADVAGRAGLSTRALQEGFVRHVGVSPMTYLRQVRLRRVHADLRAADPAVCSVAQIAGRWGFTHLGRFAAVYQERYGEAPSQTLRSGRLPRPSQPPVTRANRPAEPRNADRPCLAPLLACEAG
jgi:AraC-like DNA-binding protein